QEESAAPLAVTGAVKSYSPEFNISANDTGLLASLSQATGGRVIDDGTGTTGEAASGSVEALTPASGSPDRSSPTSSGLDLFERKTAKTIPHDIWDKLLVLALLLLPIDVALRRLRVNREDIRAALAAMQRWIYSTLPWPRFGALETGAPGAVTLGLAQL